MTEEQRRLIERAMRREEKLLVRWLTGKLGDRDTAQDVAQSVFLRVWKFAMEQTVENPRALIFKTAGNLAINEMKRRNLLNTRLVERSAHSDRDPIEVIASSAPSPEREISTRQELQPLMDTIHQLPERPRRAFMLNRFEGKNYTEISQILGVSKSSCLLYTSDAADE